MLSYDDLGAAELAGRLARSRFRVDRANVLGLAEHRTPDELLALLRRSLTPRGLPAGLGGAIGLADGMVHQQDIRRTLGLQRTIPAERLVPALWTVLFAPVLLGVVRVRDVRLVATDLDWAFGRGPEVRGTGEALLMAVAGRRGVSGELTGPRAARLARR